MQLDHTILLTVHVPSRYCLFIQVRQRSQKFLALAIGIIFSCLHVDQCKVGALPRKEKRIVCGIEKGTEGY